MLWCAHGRVLGVLVLDHLLLVHHLILLIIDRTAIRIPILLLLIVDGQGIFHLVTYHLVLEKDLVLL